MTDDELDRLTETYARAMGRQTVCCLDHLALTDAIPALVAEVRRLRALVEE